MATSRPPRRPGRQASGSASSSIPHFVSVDFAHATQVVLYCMCGIMAFAGLIGLRGLKRGVQEVSADEAMPGAAAEPA